MDDGTKAKSEIVSLNKELMSFDFDEIGVEELERRLELAIAALPDFGNCGTNDCNSFSGDCGSNSCNSNG